MLAANEMQNSLLGAWRLMTGRADGLRLLDLSADGFWNSFFAMVVALPPLFVSWTSFANEISPGPEMFGERLGLMPRLAVVDFCAWVVPLVGLAAAAKPAGIAGRFVHYVVASNWASAIIAWMMMPPALLRLIFPAAADVASLISFALFLLSMLLSWRLTNATLNRGPAVATAVFAAMFAASVVVLLALQSALGLATAGQISG
ncbi:MAG TPA: transporter [Rhizobiaceae bacterium]|nr:transporter [Rhizobiaceae bacterium]